jgi:hypothetical protein
MGAEMNEREALKLALEALEFYYDLYKEKVDANVITAIKEALAQPKQKPVAWMREDEDCTDCIVWEQTEEHTIPLYTAPPQRTWIGLTEEERDHFEGLHLYAARNQVEAWIEGVPAFIDAIQAKLREKNGG